MKKLLALIFFTLGATMAPLGMLLLLSGLNESRLLFSGSVLLLLGAVFAWYGKQFFVDANRLKPGLIKRRVLQLSGQNRGLVSLSLLSAEYPSLAEVSRVMQALESEKICRKVRHGNHTLWVFSADLSPEPFYSCPFCLQTQAEQKSVCPHCQGSLGGLKSKT